MVIVCLKDAERQFRFPERSIGSKVIFLTVNTVPEKARLKIVKVSNPTAIWLSYLGLPQDYINHKLNNRLCYNYYEIDARLFANMAIFFAFVQYN
jgi:hypothetical protein